MDAEAAELPTPFENGSAFSTEWQPQVTPTGPSSLFMPISSSLIPSTLPLPQGQQSLREGSAKKGLQKKKKQQPQSSPKLSESGPQQQTEGDEQSQKEGSNIHFAADGKKLCSYSHKLCKQRRMDGRSFCIKHILEDPNSGFHQCEYICKKKSGKRCTNPVPNDDGDSQYCSHHRQILGLQPRKSSHKRTFSASKKRVAARSQEAHHQLVELLAKQGIPQLSAKRSSQDLPRKSPKVADMEGNDEDVAISETSSDEFPSEEELSDSDSEPFDGDSFFADTFLNHYEESDTEHDYLRDAVILTEEETISRRKVKITKLLRLYKLQYRRLQDILRTRHELYMKRMDKLKEGERLKHEKIEDNPFIDEVLKQTMPRESKGAEERNEMDRTERDESLDGVTEQSIAPISKLTGVYIDEGSIVLEKTEKPTPEQTTGKHGGETPSLGTGPLPEQDKEREREDNLSVMMQHYSHIKEGKELAASMQDDADKIGKAPDVDEAPNCILRGCKGKCVLLTNYCFAHILQDHNQKLFKGCTYISPEGNKCNYPILVTQKPPICNGHIDLVGGAKRERRKRKANAVEKQKKEMDDREPEKTKQDKKPKQRQKRRKEETEPSSGDTILLGDKTLDAVQEPSPLLLAAKESSDVSSQPPDTNPPAPQTKTD